MFKNFLRNVRGIFYFSTPHQGIEVVDGSNFSGELAQYVKLLSASTAQMNDKFQKLRRERKWRTGGLGHLLEGQERSIRLPEATMRYDTDVFRMEQKTWEAINKPNSQQSSCFEFFLLCVRFFIEDHLEEESNEEYEKFISRKVGLRSSVDQVVSLLTSLEKAEGNVSGVVLHGTGGIGKSTLGEAVFLKMSKKFDPDCRCSVDREAVANPTRPPRKLQKSMLESLRSGSKPYTDRKKILRALKKCYTDANRPLLIFIDNIENEDDLDDIFPDDEINLPRGSYILLASRNLEMCTKLQLLKVRKVCSYAVKELDGISARELFLQNALIKSDGSQQEQKWRDVREILDICSGLPLALKVIGAALAGLNCSDWGNALGRLKNCLPVGGTKEDKLWSSLEFSYNQLHEAIQRVFLDIVFCFKGSPWNELKLLYGDSLRLLEQKALITKDRRLEHAPSLQFPTVKVHALLAVLGEKKGKALGSHLKMNVRQDYAAQLGRISSFQFNFFLESEGRCNVLVLDGNPSNFSYPSDEDTSTYFSSTEGEAHFPASWSGPASSLRILILQDVLVCGTLGEGTIPQNLECFICSNSNVPFRNGDFTSLKKLKHVEITTTRDTNDTYKFPDGVRKVRLQNNVVERTMFGTGGREYLGSRKQLEEFGLMSVNRLLLDTSLNQFTTLKKVVLRNISGLDNNLPKALFRMKSLRSLSIRYCEHVSLLPDFDMGGLEHLQLALPHLVGLPNSLQTLGALASLTLQSCRLLTQLPALAPGVRFIAISSCPNLRALPSDFHEVQRMKESESSVLELQLQDDWRQDWGWQYYSRDELDSTQVEGMVAATHMPPLISEVEYTRGMAIIISMEEGRLGCDIDRHRLVDMAEYIKFRPLVIVDQTADELPGILQAALEEVNEEDECLLCCVSADGFISGGKQFIYGSQRENQSIDLLSVVLEPVFNCPKLVGKPKVLLINTSRVFEGHVDPEPDQITPMADDCLLMYSCVPGETAWRRQTGYEKGTLFLGVVADQIKRLYQTTDVQGIFAEVKRRVPELATNLRIEQEPVIHSSLNKRLSWRPRRRDWRRGLQYYSGDEFESTQVEHHLMVDATHMPPVISEVQYRRGVAIIISMEKDRLGSEIDRRRFVDMAGYIEFFPVAIVDQTADELPGTLQAVLEQVNEEDECLLSCVSAHGFISGGKQFIYESQRENQSIDLLSVVLEPVFNCPKLVGKPKVLLINASRVFEGHVDPEPDQITPMADDCLLMYSCVPGETAWRRQTGYEKGTLFLGVVADQIKRLYQTTDVQGIFAEVKRRVPELATKLLGKGQEPVIHSSLNKRLSWRPR